MSESIPEISTEMDPTTGAVIITVPAELVRLLGWQSNSTILYIADPDEKTILAKLAK